MTRRPALLPLAGLVLLMGAAPATDPVVAKAGRVTLSASAVAAMLAALPPQARARMSGDPAAVAELVRGAMVTALLYAQAHAKGFDAQPLVAAAAERARQAEIVREFVASALAPPQPPSDAALQPLYEANKPRFMLPRQFHLAQIFLALPANAAPALVEQRRAQLAELRRRCDGKPQAFADAARRLSEDRRSAPDGGDLGWLAEDKLIAPIRGAVAGMQIGGLSDPLRTDDGWHLLALTGTQAAGPASFAQVRPALAQAYAEQQLQAATRAYLDQVLARTPVELNAPALRSLAR